MKQSDLIDQNPKPEAGQPPSSSPADEAGAVTSPVADQPKLRAKRAPRVKKDVATTFDEAASERSLADSSALTSTAREMAPLAEASAEASAPAKAPRKSRSRVVAPLSVVAEVAVPLEVSNHQPVNEVPPPLSHEASQEVSSAAEPQVQAGFEGQSLDRPVRSERAPRGQGQSAIAFA